MTTSKQKDKKKVCVVLTITQVKELLSDMQKNHNSARVVWGYKLKKDQMHISDILGDSDQFKEEAEREKRTADLVKSVRAPIGKVVEKAKGVF